jgi:Xaa-Pro aminopeptidase
MKQILKNKKLDAVILINNPNRVDPNFVYFTGLKGSFGCLIIKPSQKLLLLHRIDIHRKLKTKIKTEPIAKGLFHELKKLKLKRIGINDKSLTVFLYKKLKKELKYNLIDISEELENLRAIKTDNEIKLIKKSCGYADEVIQEAIKFADKTKTEMQVQTFIKKKINDLGLETSFEPIVSCSSPKKLHKKPLNKKLKGFVVIDMGVKYKNYCSDITRTIYIGNPSKKEIEDYNKVLKLQKELIESDEIDCNKLDSKARKILGKNFIHGLGHGLGIEVHEKPFLNPKTKDILKDNMVFTIEPGLYKKQGIRIEDDVFVKNNKKILLTKTKKDLIIK